MSNDLIIKQTDLPAAPALQQTGTNNVAVANQPGPLSISHIISITRRWPIHPRSR